MYDDNEVSQKFCPHCGATRPDGSTFCPSCGGQATGGPQKGVVQARVQYAGFWIRFVAALIGWDYWKYNNCSFELYTFNGFVSSIR